MRVRLGELRRLVREMMAHPAMMSRANLTHAGEEPDDEDDVLLDGDGEACCSCCAKAGGKSPNCRGR